MSSCSICLSSCQIGSLRQVILFKYNWCDVVVVRASASQSVDLGYIPQVKSCQKTLKSGNRSFPAWLSAHRDSLENKPASLFVVSLGKALSGNPPSSCGRQVAGPSCLSVVVAQSDKRHANRA